jgi:hypothetical protein
MIELLLLMSTEYIERINKLIIQTIKNNIPIESKNQKKSERVEGNHTKQMDVRHCFK